MDAVTLAVKTPAEEINGLPDHGLIEAMVAARRLASQAQAVELAAVAELTRRRRTEDAGPGHRALSPAEYLHDEVAGALTLTSNATDDLIRFAAELTERLPETFAALSAGEIDYLKARTLWHGTDRLTPPLAAAIEAKVLPRAQAQTTGQIRAKIRRPVKQLDPETLDRRRALAEQQRGVHLVETDDGTAHLTGRPARRSRQRRLRPPERHRGRDQERRRQARHPPATRRRVPRHPPRHPHPTARTATQTIRSRTTGMARRAHATSPCSAADITDSNKQKHGRFTTSGPA